MSERQLCDDCGEYVDECRCGPLRDKIAKLEADLAAAQGKVEAVKQAFACAIVWACTEQGGYTELDQEYFKWAKAVVDTLSDDAVSKDIFDKALAALAEDRHEQ